MSAKVIRKLVASFALIGAASSQVHANSITYVVNDVVGAGSLIGTITTNGTLGELGQNDVVAWDLTLTSAGVVRTLTQANSIYQIVGNGFTATASGLFFDFGIQGALAFNGPGFDTINNIDPIVDFGLVCLSAFAGFGCGGVSDSFTFSLQTQFLSGTGGVSYVVETGNVQIAGVPGPAAGTGLPGLIACGGLLGWSRWRRKAEVRA